MERIKSLNKYQKSILIVLLLMPLLFAVVYVKTISKVGFAYKDTILVPSQEDGSTVYSGKIGWEQARFEVTEDKVVVFQYGDRTYGPYTAKVDPTAIPKDEEMRDRMTGVELREGEEILFRGGILDMGDFYWLYNEDGTPESLHITFVTNDGLERDENGNVIDPMEPSAESILMLMKGPELTHKGDGRVWFAGAFLCMLNILSLLFAEELFRMNLAFRIRNVDSAEPSDWELAGRYVSWIAVTVVALVLFVAGLQ